MEDFKEYTSHYSYGAVSLESSIPNEPNIFIILGAGILEESIGSDILRKVKIDSKNKQLIAIRARVERCLQLRSRGATKTLQHQEEALKRKIMEVRRSLD